MTRGKMKIGEVAKAARVTAKTIKGGYIMAGIEQMELAIQDNAIHCEGCESRIETVLKRLPGVVKVKADHKSQKVSLALDTGKTPVDEVKEKLGAAGYQAS